MSRLTCFVILTSSLNEQPTRRALTAPPAIALTVGGKVSRSDDAWRRSPSRRWSGLSQTRLHRNGRSERTRTRNHKASGAKESGRITRPT